MDIIKFSMEWAKAEVFSAKMVGLYSLFILLTALAFYLLGKTPVAKAFIWPLAIAGILMIIVSGGLYFSNQPRIEQFQNEYIVHPLSFIKKEIQRTAKSQKDFELVFKILPLIIIIAALLIVFTSTPLWRATGITIILLMVSLMFIDSNTEARNAAYHEQLLIAVESKTGNN